MSRPSDISVDRAIRMYCAMASAPPRPEAKFDEHWSCYAAAKWVVVTAEKLDDLLGTGDYPYRDSPPPTKLPSHGTPLG